MKKIGIYGGTFSPPHLGHRHAVEAFASSLALDEVIVMPVNIPPHKQALEEVDAAMRLAMTRIAFRDLSYVTVSDWEIEAGEISYTANTLCHFAPMGELYFLCGGDMFLTLPDWYRPDLIFQHAVIAVASRDADQDEAPPIGKTSAPGFACSRLSHGPFPRRRYGTPSPQETLSIPWLPPGLPPISRRWDYTGRNRPCLYRRL